jgi:NADPH:quinone reductase-like Zn-dependent oxidoreductase
MKGFFHDRYGPPDVLEFRDLDIPPVGEDEVLIRAHAAGVNRGDVLAVEGLPYTARLGYGIKRPKHHVPGTDVAGTVEAVGSGVTGLQLGDAVFGWATGGFAQYATAPANLVVAKPERLTFEQAAASPTTGVAALQGLRDVGRITAGHRVLVVGASGGVGTFAVQMAKAHGANVTAVCSTRNVDLVRSAGADQIIDYTREDFTRRRAEFDLILDLVGKESLRSSTGALKPGGTFVVVAGGNPRSMTGMGRFAQTLRSPFGRHRLRPLFSTKKSEDLSTLGDLLEAGKVLPVMDAVYDLADLPEAMSHVRAGHARGRVVITV